MAHVLIVDDVESVRTTLGAFVEKDGHEVSLASDADEALGLLQEHSFDVVVTDIILPRKTGVALLGDIRDTQPDVQVIMITGEPEIDSASNAVRKGAFDYLSKPVSRDDITRTVAAAAAKKALLDKNRLLEEENRRYREHLEELVDERTEQLRNSETRYRTLFSGIADPVFVFDQETDRFLDCNQSALDRYGYTIDELQTMTPHDFHPPSEKEQVDANIPDTEDLSPNQYTHVARSGKRFPVEVHTTNLLYEGRPAWISIVRDITQRKQAEEALRRQMERAQQYLDVAATMFVVIDTASVVTLVNKRGCEILGYKREQIVGKNWFENFIPASLREELMLVSEKLLAGELEDLEYHENPILTKSGEERLIAWHNTILRDNQGRIVGHLSSGTDISTRRQAETALAERVKELTCLHYVNQLLHQDPSDKSLYEQIAQEVAAAMQHVSLARVSIELDGKHYGSTAEPDEEAPPSLSSEIAAGEIRFGRLRVWYTEVGQTFLDEERELVDTLGRDIGKHLSEAEAQRMTDRLLKQQTHINALALALGHAVRIEDIYATACRRVSELLDVSAFIVSLYDDEEKLLRAGYAQFDGKPFDVLRLPPIPLEEKGRGAQSEVVRSGKPLYLPDFRKTQQPGTTEYTVADGEDVREGRPPDDADDITRSALLVPLKVEGKTIGVMQIQSYCLDEYDQDDIDLLAGLANVVAVAVRTAKLVEEIEADAKVLESTLDGVIQALAVTTETRDPYTAGHQQRVTRLACAIAERMGIPDEQREGIRVASLLHDIGKMSVPAEILSKPVQLTETEFALIRSHSAVAYNILEVIDFPWPVADIVLQHHERLDGSGYPKGLKGEEIMVEARIIGVADVVEAMASHRPYRPTLGIDVALKAIRAKRGIHYDPDAVDACLALFEEDGFELRE